MPSRALLLLSAAMVLLLAGVARAQYQSLDTFEQDVSTWKALPSDGVKATLERVSDGGAGHAMRLNYNFEAGMGFVVIRRALPIDLPKNYRFTFRMRAQSATQNFEFKLVDAADENVWWRNNKSFDFPTDWTDVQYRPRHLRFAWGPSGGKVIEKLGYLEFAIASVSGGQGWVEFDDIGFEPLPEPEAVSKRPSVRGKVDAWESDRRVLTRIYEPGELPEDGSVRLNMFRRAEHRPPSLVRVSVDLQQRREHGGLIVDFDREDYPVEYSVLVSDDNENFSKLYDIKGGKGGRRYLPIPDGEGRAIWLDATKVSRDEGLIIRRIEVPPVEFASSPNSIFERMSADAPRGMYPRYTRREMTYWNVVGVSGDPKESLINADGMVELDKMQCSIEPMLRIGERVYTWADVTSAASLEPGGVPIPSVTWTIPGENGAGAATMKVTALADGSDGASTVLVRYLVTNTGQAAWKGELALGVRPFQVLPPWQELNLTGGHAIVKSIEIERDTWRPRININNQLHVHLLTPQGSAGRTGASHFFAGEALAQWAQFDEVPSEQRAADPVMRSASAVATWPLHLQPGQSTSIVVGWGLSNPKAAPARRYEGSVASQSDLIAKEFEARLANQAKWWNETLSRVSLSLPPSARQIADTFRAQQGYILINRDGPSIQPGSRTYERSWIRDGSLTGTALLATGHTDEVRQFIEWYAPYIYPSGKVPCVVDRRGPDPVPEYDSQGQLIYAIAKYYKFTRDKSFLERHLPYIEKSVAYIQELRAQRMTELYKTGPATERAKYGLVPESISHEGYSAKPMHSYWDGFFVIKGLKDAAFVAGELGRSDLQVKYSALLEEYRTSMWNSMRLAMENTGVDYIPGCVELGDFDATSTAIGLWPCGELGNIPEPQLTNTFEKWWQFFQDRRDGKREWRDYTPYEARLIGTQIYLGKPERAWALMDFYLADQRPQGWNHWAEVVWRDPKHPGFVGDMPHTWCGSDWMNAVRTMFVYETDRGALVLGAGVKPQWLSEPDGSGKVAGISLARFPTEHGTLSYAMRAEADGSIVVELGEGLTPGPGRVELMIPGKPAPSSVEVNGQRHEQVKDGRIILDGSAARIVVR